MGPDGEFVPLMVPRRHYERMVAELSELLAAERNGTDETVPEGESEGAVTIERDGKRATYDSVMLATIKAGALTHPTIRALFEMTSAQPDRPIPLPAIRERAGVSPEQARGHLAGFSQFVKRKVRADLWPFHTLWIPGSKGQPGTMAYSMPSALAGIWKRLA